MPATPFAVAQGITFSFNNVAYTATSLSVSRNRGEFDVSTIDLAANTFRRFRAGKVSNVELKVDWIGGTIPPANAVCPFAISGTDLGATDFSGKSAVCTGLTITAAAGDIVKGSATFKLSSD